MARVTLYPYFWPRSEEKGEEEVGGTFDGPHLFISGKPRGNIRFFSRRSSLIAPLEIEAGSGLAMLFMRRRGRLTLCQISREKRDNSVG